MKIKLLFLGNYFVVGRQIGNSNYFISVQGRDGGEWSFVLGFGGEQDVSRQGGQKKVFQVEVRVWERREIKYKFVILLQSRYLKYCSVYF